MRKHFKKIAMGLSLVMAVSMAAPAAQATYAAEKAYDVTLGTKERRAITEETLEIGEEIDLNFYGVKDWNKNQTNYECKWSVKGDAVTVDNKGLVRAVKDGTAVVSLSIEDKVTGVSHNVTPTTIIVKAEPEVTPEPTDNPFNELKNIDTSTIKSVNGGVVLTRSEDGYIKAYNYDGEEIPLNGNYDIIEEAVSAEGQFALSDGFEIVHVFDKEGNVILELPLRGEDGEYTELEIYINENHVVYALLVDESDWVDGAPVLSWGLKVYIYDILNQTTTLVGGPLGLDYITRMHDGMFFMKTGGYHSVEDYTTSKVLADGSKETVRYYYAFDNTFDDLYSLSFGGASNDGYLLTWGGGTYRSHDYSPYVAGLMSEDGTQLCLVNLNELFNEIYQCNMTNEEIKESEEVDIRFPYAWEDNMWCGNYQKQIVVQMKYGELSTYMLFDFENAEIGEDYFITNLDEVIVAQYDYISISPDGYYLAGEGDDWFYIDETGAKVADYKDCSNFRNGYALVIDEDDMAYLVDKKFNKLTAGQPATSVSVTGAAFVITNGDEHTYLVLE